MGGYGVVNPAIQGLLQGFSVANMIQRAKLEQEAQARAQQAQEHEQQVQDADLAIRINALGGRPMTPSDELEANTGVSTNYSIRPRDPNAGMEGSSPMIVPSFGDSDIKSRIVSAGGKKYVLPTQDEQFQTKLDQSKALAKAGEDVKQTALQDRLAKTGIPISDENATLLGLPKGQKILPENVDDYMRAVASARASQARNKPGIAHAWATADDNGQYVVTVGEDGKVSTQPITVGGKKIGQKTGSASGGSAAADKLAQSEALQQAASYAYTQAGNDPKKAEDLAKQIANDPKSPYRGYFSKNQLAIVGLLRKAQVKPKSISQMSPDELMNALGGDDESGDNNTQGSAAAAPQASRRQPAPSGNALSYIQGLKKRKAGK